MVTYLFAIVCNIEHLSAIESNTIDAFDKLAEKSTGEPYTVATTLSCAPTKSL